MEGGHFTEQVLIHNQSWSWVEALRKPSRCASYTFNKQKEG
jgi:hypothetical protein